MPSIVKPIPNTSEWEAKLKSFWDRIKRTDELADLVRRELDIFGEQICKVCTNAECTVEAIKLLYFDLLEVYTSIIMLKENLDGDPLCCTVGLNDKLDQIEDPGLPKDSGIRKCLADFGAKLDVVLGLQNDAFKKVLEALKCAYLLLEYICEENDGLKRDIEELTDCFGGVITDDEVAPCEPTPGLPVRCCLDFDNLPTFPIKENAYYIDTQAQYEAAKAAKELAQKDMNNERQDYEAVKACYDSLCDAIEKAKAAKSGK
jgi:hypothetical protein